MRHRRWRTSHGERRYYKADSPTQLETALDDIASSVVGCSYQLDGTPGNTTGIFVFCDNATVP